MIVKGSIFNVLNRALKVMREAVDIVKQVKKLEKSKKNEAEVQLKILKYYMNSNSSDIEADLKEMYDSIFFEDSKDVKKLHSSFKSQEIEAVSDILAWLLEVPKAVHNQNKKYLDAIIR